MIQKIYEIACDWCGNAEHYHVTSFQAAEQAFRSAGCVVVPNKYHYCNENCAEQHERQSD